MGRGDVLVKQAQGRGARCTREVELGELALGEGEREASPLPLQRRGDADIVGIHNCVVFRVVRC